MATRKKTATPKSKPARRRTASRQAPRSAIAKLEAELPPTLRDFSRRVRRGLTKLEKRIEKEGQQARRRYARMLRQASHRLGELEAQGEREWRKQSQRARSGTVKLLRQLENTIESPRKKKARRNAAPHSRRGAAA